METTSKQLEQWNADIDRALDGVGRGRVCVMSAVRRHRDGGGDNSKLYSELDTADDYLFAGQEALDRLHSSVPASPSLPSPKQVSASSLDLSALSTFGSDDSRELLALLDRAQAVAERIDAARGYTVGDTIPLLPGESRGTDLAESVSILALRVRKEAEGGRSPHE